VSVGSRSDADEMTLVGFWFRLACSGRGRGAASRFRTDAPLAECIGDFAATKHCLALCTFQVEIIRDFLKGRGLHSGPGVRPSEGSQLLARY
jgi:hypothetical protein